MKTINRSVLLLSFALSIALMGCSSNDDTPIPTKDIEIEYMHGEVYNLTPEILQSYANDPTIRTIYIVPVENHWYTFAAHNITYTRKNFLQPRLDISKKIRGKGDFNFKVGEASKVPEDSLWYVANGWTINKDLQSQK